jgi:hypothetical protein
MSDSLGLSIGMTNLVAARIGRPPVMRRSVLTLFDDRPPEVGLPSEFAASSQGANPPQGMVLSGFVERVGDPVPLVAADGSPHRGEQVLVEALDAMARTVDGGAPVAIAIPAHWGPPTVGALRGALRAKPALSPNGVPAALIPDSVAALAALQAAPGLPSEGVVVLCDFGGSGTSITLADAGSNFDPIGETVRYPEFSGDQIDQALLNHVLAGIAEANDSDPAGTAAVGSLARLRNESRRAKERLSAETATVIAAELPGFSSDVRVTRTELDQLIAEPLGRLLDNVEETLQRNNIPAASISAVATVGGGANIPLVTQQLSTRLRAPVVTTPQSQLNVAAGAALVADTGLSADAPTGMAAASSMSDAPTGMAAAGWAAGAAGLAASESASDGAASATFRALAWSQDDAPGGEPVPYSGEDYTFEPGATGARPPMEFAHEEEGYPPEPGPLPWYKRPPILFGAAAAAALLAIGGLAITLTSSGSSSPVTETATTVKTGPSPVDPATQGAPETVTVTGPDGRPSTTVVPSPTGTTATTTDETTTTTTAPTTTTTTAPTTTTTTAPTTTQPTTTRPTTTQPPTTQQPTTVAPPVTTVQPLVPNQP